MSNQSIKSKLREQTKKNHQEFRQQLVDDVAAVLQKWKQHSTTLHDTQLKQVSKLHHDIEKLLEEVKISKAATSQIRDNTVRELRNLKRSHSWGYVIITVLVAIISTITTLLAIRYLF